MRRELVLVGGGHAHVQVLRRLMMRPLADVRVCVVLDRPEAVYSGMVPGLAAGDYRAHELEIDVVPLARRAGAAVVLSAARRIDPAARRIELEGRPPIPYDVASLDVGSSVRGLDLPGVREHALATRPIRDFVDALGPRLEAARRAAHGAALRVAVVGGGAAGTELAFVLRARLAGEGIAARLSLFCDAPRILGGYPERAARAAARELRRAGIAVRCGARALGVEKDALLLEGERVPADLVVWATGAAPPAELDLGTLPRDAAGFVRVEDTLQVVGCAGLFAAGDCASLDAYPWVPKAGVYAVREGPVLDANLRALLSGRALRAYRPQRDFLSLLNLGERRALAAKWGMAAVGRWVWRWKDHIDRRFVRRFRVLDAAGGDAPGFPTPEQMGMREMECGGCAAKVGASALERALARLDPGPRDPRVLLGLERPDDAAAVRTARGDVVLATVDAFRAFCDDPWLVGRVAAINALSDVWAKGGTPRHALTLVTTPAAEPERAEETLYQVLAGVRSALDPLGVSLVGGHSTLGMELFVGLSIHGELDPGASLRALAGLRPGDRLILSKPLGTGVILAADMQGRAAGGWVRAAHASMARPNERAARVAAASDASGGTDVSGFGLAGHLGSLLRASAVSACLELRALPALEGALALLAAGRRSSFHAQNAEARSGVRITASGALEPAAELLFDPQTSGGLLFGVAPERVEPALAALRAAGDVEAACIGRVEPPRSDELLIEARG
jgi:selenide,water dikinase